MRTRIRTLVALAALASACSLFERAGTVPSPFAAYKPPSEERSLALANEIAAGLNEGKPEAFDSVVDLVALVGHVLKDVKLEAKQRSEIVSGVEAGMRKSGRQSLGRSLVDGVGEGATARVLRAHEVGGQRRVLVRMLGSEGLVNYYDLVLGENAAGEVRVIDFFNFVSGELFSDSVRGIVLPMLAELQKTKVEKLVSGSQDWSALTSEGPKLRQALAEGRPADAMKIYEAFPEHIRTNRAGLMLRVQCAQAIDDATYEAALDAIDAKYPGDPSFALLQVDRHALRKDWKRAIESIRLVSKAVGGDAHLDVMHANMLVESGAYGDARAAAQKAIAAEPDLQEAWWSLVGTALASRDHAKTAELLTEVEERFDVEFADLTTLPEYEAFVASPEYARWLKRAR